jgi:hypothetical protein
MAFLGRKGGIYMVLHANITKTPSFYAFYGVFDQNGRILSAFARFWRKNLDFTGFFGWISKIKLS